MRPLLYYVTDRAQMPGDEAARRRALLDKIAEAARAGVDYIQLREKDLSARELEILARQAVSAIRELRISHDERPASRLLVNSRADIAIAAGAEGVHLRSDDIPVPDARSVWAHAATGSLSAEARRPLVTVSCHTADDVFRAEEEGADFAVFAPVFGKTGSAPAGLGALRKACGAKIPVLALGGVTLENAGACLEAGAAGIAGIRIFQENRVEEITRALRSR